MRTGRIPKREYGDYSSELWKEVSPQQKQKEIQADLKRFGDLVEITLVDRSDIAGQRGYRYRLKFKNTIILQHVVFDKENKLALSDSEAME